MSRLKHRDLAEQRRLRLFSGLLVLCGVGLVMLATTRSVSVSPTHTPEPHARSLGEVATHTDIPRPRPSVKLRGSVEKAVSEPRPLTPALSEVVHCDVGALDWFEAQAWTLDALRAAPLLRPHDKFDMVEIHDYYSPPLFSCLLEHYPKWPDVRERAARALEAGTLPTHYEPTGGRSTTLPAARGAPFMALNVSDANFNDQDLLPDATAAFWLSYRRFFGDGSPLHHALVDKFNTTIRKRFDRLQTTGGAMDDDDISFAQADEGEAPDTHRLSSSLARHAAPLRLARRGAEHSMEGAGTFVTLRLTGGGPNGYQGFTGGVHGEDRDRVVTALSYIAESDAEPEHMGMLALRSKDPSMHLREASRMSHKYEDYTVLHEAKWFPNVLFAFAGCDQSWHSAAREASRCGEGGEPWSEESARNLALSKRNMMQTLVNTEMLDKSSC